MIPFYTNLKNPIKSVVLTTFLVFFFISFLQAQINPADWETNASSANARSATTLKGLPSDARKATISIADFKRKLQKTTQEISIPTPDGNYETFLIEPTNVVAKEVAHLYTIKTFKGYKKDDPSILIACDISDYGFHAGIYAGKNTYFVEPASTDNSAVKEHYIYSKKQAKSGKVKCGVQANSHKVQQAINASKRSLPTTKRTYRLGIVASGEYSQQFGGSPYNVTNVLNALASGVNLINPIYLRDLGVEFTLVTTTAMVYSDPNSDPFDLDDQIEIIESSHSLCVAALGINGFDLGHVVIWENVGGLASVGVVCNSDKGEGFSASDASVTTLWVDYVAHEIGHQFGAQHNFSSQECETSTDGFRFEPGEGSSIMAYSNICDINARYAASTDPYFHYASIKTMQDFIATTSCATTSSTGNSSDPVVSAQNNITIPKQTPFVLIGSATDANDPAANLTYDWVQFDGNGNATTGTPDCNSTTAPLFRYRPPGPLPFRNFPLYADVIAGNNNSIAWEKLPCQARTMNFSLTVRDNNPFFGRLTEDKMVVTVANTGPFAVTAPNGGETLTGNTATNITWTVNGTDTHCSNVDILLSTDGGGTYSVIANATANDGAETVAIPNTASGAARILIRCDVVGDFRAASTFYDVSNNNFTINAINIVDMDDDGIEADIDCNDNDPNIGAQQTPGTACNDGNVNTENDVILADGCGCAGTLINTVIDNDNDGFSAAVDCDDNNASINPGATEVANNNIDENCDGTILVIDADNDGQNSSVDCNDNDATIGAQQTPGTPCNDGNVNTNNDVIQPNGCDCVGTSITSTVDNDKDGFTADVDCDDNNAAINPGATEVPNNNVDENCDGMAQIIDNDNDGQNSSVDCNDNDATVGPIQAAGTPCDDGNANTTNDVIQPNGCTCSGALIGSHTDNDGDGFASDVDCDDNNSGINPNAMEVPNNNVDENCDGFILIIDNDNDGQNSSVDCNDNDATIGPIQATGTPCNDGNPNTHNDVILANGCTCAGTPINNTTDNDNDGFSADVDCDDNNPAINPGATEVPNNAIDENCDGVDDMTPGMSMCFVPSGIHANVLSARNVFIDWNDIITGSSYTVQVRYKGQTNWLVTVEVFVSKLSIFGPSNSDYEFRIKTNCSVGESAYSDILSYSTTHTLASAASSRNLDDSQADVVIAETVQLTPNPVKKELSLHYSATKNATVNIYHASGQLVKQIQIASNNYLRQINVSNLEAGLYLLTIEEAGKSPITKRFIKAN